MRRPHLATGQRVRRLADARRDRDGDAGSVLVVALVISFVVVVATTAALTTSSASVEQTGAFTATTSARLAAESGIQATLVAMENASSSSTLPACTGPPTSVGSASYTVTVAYSAGCPLPAQQPQAMSASITSTGAAGSTSVTIQANVTIDNKPVLPPAYQYAIYAPGGVPMSMYATVDSSDGTPTASIFSGGGFNCTNGNVIQGDVLIYNQSSFSMSVDCAITGQVSIQGSINMTNTSSIGSAEAIGGSIQLQNTSTIPGSAYAVRGSISIGPSATVGHAYATGSISGGTDVHPNDQAIADMSMPPEPSSPNANGGLNVAALVNSTIPSLEQEGYQYHDYSSSCSTATSGLPALISGAGGTPLVIYAPCYVSFAGKSGQGASSCPNGSTTYTLSANVVLIADGIGSYGCNLFTTSGSHENLAIIVPWDTGAGISLSGVTDFASNVSTLLTAGGDIETPNYSSLTGQIIAGAQVGPTNYFHLTFSNAASAIVPGLGGNSEQVTLDKQFLLKD